MESFNIFTDGSALNNSKNAPGGAAVLFVNSPLLISCSKYGTNNVHELNAIRYALRTTLNNLSKFNIKNTINLYTDSEYSINVILGIYKAKANIELIEKCRYYLNELKKHHITVVFHHVRAHTNKTDAKSFCNDIVDKAANKAAMELSESKVERIWSIIQLDSSILKRLTDIDFLTEFK